MTTEQLSGQSGSELTIQAMISTQADDILRILQTNLERIRTNDREYYDFIKDQADIKQYYEEIDFTESDGGMLFSSLSWLLKNTHRYHINTPKATIILKHGSIYIRTVLVAVCIRGKKWLLKP